MQNFFKSMWDGLNKLLANPVVYMIWHALLGGVAGYATDIAAGNAVPTWHGLLGAALGGIIGWARQSTNPTEAQIASIAEQALRAKGLIKMVLFLVMFGFGSTVMAQETTGWGINPEFSAPYMFGQDASGTFISVPSFGLGADIGWKDFVTNGNEKSVKYSAGLVLSGNLSQAQPTGPKSVLNGLLGLEAGYKGINFVVGNQLLGDPLTGPGGSRWLIYVGYDASSLLGGWSSF